MAKEEWKGFGITMMCTPFRTQAGARKFIEKKIPGVSFSADPNDRRFGMPKGVPDTWHLVPRGRGWQVCRPAKGASLAGARRARRKRRG